MKKMSKECLKDELRYLGLTIENLTDKLDPCNVIEADEADLERLRMVSRHLEIIVTDHL